MYGLRNLTSRNQAALGLGFRVRVRASKPSRLDFCRLSRLRGCARCGCVCRGMFFPAPGLGLSERLQYPYIEHRIFNPHGDKKVQMSAPRNIQRDRPSQTPFRSVWSMGLLDWVLSASECVTMNRVILMENQRNPLNSVVHGQEPQSVQLLSHTSKRCEKP